MNGKQMLVSIGWAKGVKASGKRGNQPFRRIFKTGEIIRLRDSHAKRVSFTHRKTIFVC
jgi:hypothetical protein